MRRLAVSLSGYYAKEVFGEAKEVKAKKVEAKEVKAKEVFVYTNHETVPHAGSNVTETEKMTAEETGNNSPPQRSCLHLNSSRGIRGISLASTTCSWKNKESESVETKEQVYKF